jgi:thiamine biosynthesis lipoprotein
LVQATAIAPTALEAETLSKTALLTGPERARHVLAPYGGALIYDDGDVELVGSLKFEEVPA